MENLLNPNSKTYICHICHEKFDQKEIESHIVTQHKQENTNEVYKCEICGKNFPNKNSIRSHTNIVHNKNGGGDSANKNNCNAFTTSIPSAYIFWKVNTTSKVNSIWTTLRISEGLKCQIFFVQMKGDMNYSKAKVWFLFGIWPIFEAA